MVLEPGIVALLGFAVVTQRPDSPPDPGITMVVATGIGAQQLTHP